MEELFNLIEELSQVTGTDDAAREKRAELNLKIEIERTKIVDMLQKESLQEIHDVMKQARNKK